LHFQLELDQDEEYLRELEALKAMQLARRASKRNQQVPKLDNKGFLRRATST
jgi:hypothetical protein